jgi:DNA topoisomerase VI subunit B
MPIVIPGNIECIQPYVLTAVATVSASIVFYLSKRIKEKEKENKQNIESYILDLKEQRDNIYNLSDKKTNLVLQNLENQITKLEIILQNSK